MHPQDPDDSETFQYVNVLLSHKIKLFIEDNLG